MVPVPYNVEYQSASREERGPNDLCLACLCPNPTSRPRLDSWSYTTLYSLLPTYHHSTLPVHTRTALRQHTPPTSPARQCRQTKSTRAASRLGTYTPDCPQVIDSSSIATYTLDMAASPKWLFTSGCATESERHGTGNAARLEYDLVCTWGPTDQRQPYALPTPLRHT